MPLHNSLRPPHDPLLPAATCSLVLQVVLLGSGMDSRPWRLALPPGIAWFEVDQPDVLAAKSSTLRRLGAQVDGKVRGRPGRVMLACWIWLISTMGAERAACRAGVAGCCRVPASCSCPVALSVLDACSAAGQALRCWCWQSCAVTACACMHAGTLCQPVMPAGHCHLCAQAPGKYKYPLKAGSWTTVAADLQQPGWTAALLAAGLDPAQPTCWVAEGLLYYLQVGAGLGCSSAMAALLQHAPLQLGLMPLSIGLS